MNKKQLIAKLLDKLSEEDLMELLGDEPEKEEEKEQVFNTHIHSTKSDGSGNNRRKGRGHSKASRKSSKRKGKPKKKNTGSKGKATRVLPIDVDSARPNKFEEMIGSANLDQNERVELARAAKEDEKARESKNSFKKPTRQSSLVDVECCVCRDEYEVSATLVGNIDRWKCNSCSCQAGY